MRWIRSLSVIALVLACAAAPASAQAWPERPVRILVPFPGGGAADAVVRLVANHLARALGRPVMIDNRPGGNTVIAADAAAKAAPDGYTLLVSSASTMVSNPVLFAGRLPYDPERDFRPVGLVSRLPFFVFASAKVPARDLQEFLALARARPGQLGYATNGNGTAGHIGTELLKRSAGIDLLHVPYRSYAHALPDLVAGRIAVAMADLTVFGGALQAGEAKALAVAAPDRSPLLPDVPTMAEEGFPGFDASVWFGMFAPARTPTETVARLNAELRTYLASEEARTAFAGISQVPAASSPEELHALVRADADRYGRIIREARITVD